MKVTAVAKPASHAKPAKATKKKATKARTTSKASKKTSKHAAHEAHLKHEHALHVKHEEHVAHEQKLRGLSLGEGVACCSAQALAASLRLAGAAVSDDDVLELHWRAGGTADDGVSILAALESAAEYGLAGFRPVPLPAEQHCAGCQPCRDLHDEPPPEGRGWRDDPSGIFYGQEQREYPYWAREYPAGRFPHVLSVPLILGLELPGPHAVLAGPGRWWSWGKRYDPASFPHARIEECWTVSWS